MKENWPSVEVLALMMKMPAKLGRLTPTNMKKGCFIGGTPGAGRPRKGKSNSAVAAHSNNVPGMRTKKREGGVFEKEPGLGVWRIRYFDQFGKKRREKAGTKSVAIKLYGMRKQQVLEGKKLPELFRKPSVNFGQLADDAPAYSMRNKRSYQTDVPRFASLKE